MGRHNTLLVQHASPVANKQHKQTRFATRSAHHQKPLILAKPSAPRSPALRSRLYSTNTNRYLQSRTRLPTIREEPEEEESEHVYGDSPTFAKPPASTWQHGNAAAGPSNLNRRDVEDDDDMSGWDDESTLVAMFQDRRVSPEKDADEEMLEMVEQLKEPMAAQGSALKQYLADTVLPAYSHIKDVHAVLEDKVDLEFGAGLLTFDEVCKKVERIALKDEDEIRTAHAQSQRTIAQTIAELEEAYERRKQLWSGLEEEVERCGKCHSYIELVAVASAVNEG
ncbi:hypothetical protein BN946_scf184354.g25 [Trametes cinnabarina]|uniref:Uncharacterized protein n=1 Tax=Pycnoporus cinnabarinus TaxID=5643 RepID=A0A060SCA0_PYCCI|nr:hypothetical protein BN946_scf184354.g25 [Trametes cinnabarina]